MSVVHEAKSAAAPAAIVKEVRIVVPSIPIPGPMSSVSRATWGGLERATASAHTLQCRSAARDYRGWIGLDDARVFFWQAEADRTFELCSVPKLGGAQACSASIASIGPFTVTSSAAYALVDGRSIRVDKTTGAADVFWDAGDWRVTGNVWAVTGGVEWLTSDGDLYRFDEPACWRK